MATTFPMNSSCLTSKSHNIRQQLKGAAAKRHTSSTTRQGCLMPLCCDRSSREQQGEQLWKPKKHKEDQKSFRVEAFLEIGKTLKEKLTPKQKGDWKDVVLMSLSFAVYVYMSQRIVCAYCVWMSMLRHQPWSIINGAEMPEKGRNTGKNKKGKVIYDKPLSIVDRVAPSDLSLAMKLRAQEGKTDSLLSYSSSIKNKGGKKGKKSTIAPCRSDVGVPPLLRQIGNKKFGSEVGMPTKITKENEKKSPTPVPRPKQPYYKAGGYPIAKDFAAGSVWSESEVGPSPSEVAAAIAEDSKYRQFDEGRSSLLEDKWSMQDSEGVRTKLERWRMQMPPSAYDQYSGTSGSSSTIFRGGGGGKNRRRPADAVSGGKFSCFGNLCGYECTIVCGSDAAGPKNKNGVANKRVARAPSLDSVSTYF